MNALILDCEGVLADTRLVGLITAAIIADASPSSNVEHAVRVRAGRRISVVLAGDIVEHKKPEPDIYEVALERLDLVGASTVVIEDKFNGLRAATTAGLPCLITRKDHTRNDDFASACFVVDTLGDPGTPAQPILNRSATSVTRAVSLLYVEARQGATSTRGGA